MTPALKKWLISALRRLSYRTKARTEALAAARLSRGRYTCASCSTTQPRSNIQVDHIKPVVPITGWDSWDGYLERLFCDASGLQVLCKACHSAKSTQENSLRNK